jgi:hypothetical protein
MIAARQIAFGKAAGKRKPYDAEIEYLESTGTQYIDTGVSPNNETEVETRLEVSIIDRFLFGSRFNSFERAFCIFVNSTQGYSWHPFFSGAKSTVGNVTLNTDYRVKFSSAGLVVDGVLLQGPYTNTFSGDLPMYIFAINQNGAVERRMMKGKVRYFKIRINDILVRDLIPVRKGNIGYMYDRVSGQLFGNAGTGEFVLGPDLIDYTAKDYIQDGLVAMWDGIENAGWGTNDKSVNYWKELIGGSQKVTTSAGVREWSQSGDAMESMVAFNSKAMVSPVMDNASVLNTVRSAEGVLYKSVEASVDDNISGGICLFYYNNSQYKNYWLGIKNTAPILERCYVCIDWEPDVHGNSKVRYADKDFARSGVIVASGAGYSRMFFGGEYKLGNGGGICAIRLYNRKLTDEEIAYNYNIDKQRFGL